MADYDFRQGIFDARQANKDRLNEVTGLLAGLGAFTGLVTRETDENVLNGGFNSASESLRAGGRAYSKGQTGETHAYLRYLAIGFTLIALAVLLGGRR